MRRFSVCLIVLYLLTLPAAIHPAPTAQALTPATPIKVLLPTANTTWVVGKTVAVRWIRGKYPWLKVTIQLILSPGAFHTGLPPITIAKNIPDNGHWGGTLKELPFASDRCRVRVIRGGVFTSTPVFKILTKKPK